MPRTVKHLIQIQLSEDERRWIKGLASTQGMTLRKSVLEAFSAWERQLSNANLPNKEPPKLSEPKPANTEPQEPNESHSWLQRAAKLDWTKCSDVEILAGKDRRLWVLRGTLAPLADVLQGAAEGHPLEEVAEVYQVDLPQLTKVLQFAGAP